jgi:hypothetical protein
MKSKDYRSTNKGKTQERRIQTSTGLLSGFFQVHTYSEYWSGLISSTDFTGKKLQQCLDVIHHDIVSIWNIRDSNVGHFSYRVYPRDHDLSLILQYLEGNNSRRRCRYLSMIWLQIPIPQRMCRICNYFSPRANIVVQP